MMKTKWKCPCGYIHDGNEPPAACAKCGAIAEKFVRLDAAAANLVESSRHSNALHCRLVSLAREIEAACRNGIEDNHESSCVKVFERSLAHAYEIMKLSMTEMEGHIAKGKWG